ncbi:U3 small nucleolar RNA-interacting protein (macronuclear) [Tetrahymena thermophila SB210]|uniref:U3 small nucleolar RNA-interacting protein n=1 Tax=Tetrahymena thermophila (strain SB210) TaxID=312017 RepID=Q238W3_TETTS|nr:U3 small nucleolar RNA-interacting protein [Tetrahymena thermophila SB210]EAR93107.2 U3 small nucleolar RNA-interacting protein [Tetrahymena thermophila SB210]|eukprot:XP_001013352.2 U3 small nucleolar RNA-interacting protein [Tetrahymena thermophila SB210]
MNTKKQKGNLLGKRKNAKQVLQKNIEKKPQKKKVVQNKDLDEEILSDEIDSVSGMSNEGGIEDRLIEIDDETEDKKRIRLAQQILQKAKLDSQKGKSQKFIDKIQNTGNNDVSDDESFDDGEDHHKSEGDSFQGVIYAESTHTDAITKALQNEILKKRQLQYTLYADKVQKYWNKIGQTFQQNTLKGHTRCITSLEFCPNGQYLYSASKDASIIRWDLTQTEKSKQKEFLVREKTTDAHKDEILSMSINHLGRYLVTASKDKSIKLWDLKKMGLIQNFNGHRQPINAIKFGINSNQFCTASSDRQFKMWDASDKIFIDTFFGHKADPTYIDSMSANNFISCGFDRQVIIWKTEHQSQLIYGGHDYSIDVVKAVDAEHFITGSQDGSIALWSIKKKKPIFIMHKAHGGSWITALGHLYNTDLFFSGSHDQQINAYKIDLQQKNFQKIFSIPCNGVINDIQISIDCSYLACKKVNLIDYNLLNEYLQKKVSECDEHRLGRWITDKKAKNQIKYFKIM